MRCSPAGRDSTARREEHNRTTVSRARLRVVVYRNGVASFERAGEVDTNQVPFRIRNEKVADLVPPEPPSAPPEPPSAPLVAPALSGALSTCPESA